MTPKQKKNYESANAKKGDGNSISKGTDVKKPMTDPRLKSILPLIETQLIPIQEVITDFAKVMLDNTRALKSRSATVAKFRKPTSAIQTTTTELPNPSPSLYIPKSARVKITLTYSKALANETEIKDLQEELFQCKDEFGRKIAYIFERVAKLEEKNERTSRVQAFLMHCYKLIQGIVIIEKRILVLETNLQEERFNLWVLLVLLRTLKTRRLTEQNIFNDYLFMEYKDVKEEFVKLFLPNDPTLEQEDESNLTKRLGTEEERNFIDQIIPKLRDLVAIATIKLQQNIDHDAEQQTVASLLTAKYKKAEITRATEATALAINDLSSNGQNNMEQHLKKLIQEVLKDQLTKKTSSKKQKNSAGGKKPRPSPPTKENGESPPTIQQKRKAPSSQHQVSDPKYPIDKEDLPKNKKQKRSLQQHKQTPKQTTQKKPSQRKNRKGNQGERKKGVSGGRKKNKNNESNN
jgi:hypothetical protein